MLTKNSNKPKKSSWQIAWDAWCLASIIGIWPRFIEPRLLFTKRITIPLPNLPKRLSGFTLLHLSDLHFSDETQKKFLEKLNRKIEDLAPDAIVFTGDLLCYGTIEKREDLLKWLKNLKAPFGIYAILGNHDYEQYVSLDDDGQPVIEHDRVPALFRGFSRLLGFRVDRHTEAVRTPIPPNKELIELYREAGIQVLHNTSALVGFGSNRFNLVGLGDIMAQQCLPEKAFESIAEPLPTVVLSHNPDSFPKIKRYPGDLYLFGHTHGGQVYLPFFWQKITPIIDKSLRSGLHVRDEKTLFVSRGLGTTFRFRWFAPPQMTLFQFVPKPIEEERVWKPIEELKQIVSSRAQCTTKIVPCKMTPHQEPSQENS